ncbi:MAG: bifunctional phosphoribosylaminoimidazolecarboxamide formyltransferase/IMP cyclohydrolase [Candidatus Omnitrophota bacterium]|nr:bifunctional phosphoribosylaminoimidazolecarboxamide formyltransferase/IMP cyclohydrolase [Candidatus Omnitrophota bacterium]
MSPKVKHCALISVSDKTGLVDFARELSKQKFEIISTGGTLAVLKAAGIPAQAVEKVTGFPEIFEGRVKTLHPKIHGALLYRRDKKSHKLQAARHGIGTIDLVVVNLYPFEEVTSKRSVSFGHAIENIDIGGPSMLRSAAKNFDAVTVVCDPKDYGLVIEDLRKRRGSISKSLRQHLALKVFKRTAEYDAAIASYLESKNGKSKAGKKAGNLPDTVSLNLKKVCDLRYGENPHQRASWYSCAGARFPLKQLHGKELSFNNLLDIQGTLDVVGEFDLPAACVVKHSNPCGIAEGRSIADALARAIACDPMSAFGGIVAVNQPCDQETAKVVLDRLPFFEVFVAPAFKKDALALLKKRKNLRLIEMGGSIRKSPNPHDIRFLNPGAVLVQDRDQSLARNLSELKKKLRFVTKKKLKPAQIEDLLFGWKCVKSVKSNAIVLTQGKQTVGIGAGQMSRVDSVRIACQKAGAATRGAFLASDAFFPMPDSIETARDHGIRAIIQPGGSVRDGDVIAACDEFGIAMAFTGQRHFKH